LPPGEGGGVFTLDVLNRSIDSSTLASHIAVSGSGGGLAAETSSSSVNSNVVIVHSTFGGYVVAAETPFGVVSQTAGTTILPNQAGAASGGLYALGNVTITINHTTFNDNLSLGGSTTGSLAMFTE